MGKNNKIGWCCKQKYGIELIEENKNLAEGFISKAERNLEEMRIAKYNESKINFAYYSIYNSIYSILQRIGVKCEIHACTIEFCRVFLSDYFSEEEIHFIEKAHEARNNTTYYVDRHISDEFSEDILNKAPEIISKCKSVLDLITEKEIKNLREKVNLEKQGKKPKKEKDED